MNSRTTPVGTRAKLCLRLAAAVLLFVVAAPAANVSNWVGGTSSSWTDPSNWTNGTPQNSPGSLFTAGIYSTANNPVYLGSTLAVKDLSLGSLASLQVAGGSVLTLDSGNLVNNGTLTGAIALINGASGSLGDGSSTSGTISTDSSSSLYLYGDGVGFFPVASAGILTNQGRLQVAGGASLTLTGTTDNQSGGFLQVSGTGSALYLADGLTNETGGAITVGANASLKFHEGATYTNNGTVTVNGGQLGADLAGGAITLAGTGTVQLNGGGFQTKTTWVNSAGHTIDGYGGLFGYTVNHGTITASGGTLQMPFSQFANDGVMQTDSTGTLLLGAGGDNTGGTLIADGGTVVLKYTVTGGNTISRNGGTLSLNNGAVLAGDLANGGTTEVAGTGATATISGSVTNQNGGLIHATGGNTLVLQGTTENQSGGTIQAIGTGNTVYLQGNLTNDTGGLITVSQNGQLKLHNGGTYTNNGTISLDNSELGADYASAAPVVLAGTGTVQLNNSTFASRTNWVNSAGHTIGGNGTIAAYLVNHGTVTASGGTLGTAFAQFANDGVMQTDSTGTLSLAVGGDNTGGRLIADGGTVILGSTVTGGNTITRNGGTLSLNNGALLTGDLTNGGTTQLAATGASATISGSVTNQNGGTIEVSGADTVLALTGTLTNDAGGLINVDQGGRLKLHDGGTYTNNGTISISNSSLTGDFVSSDPITLDGTGIVSLNNGTIVTKTNWVNGAGHTIAGNGAVAGNIANHGTITAAYGTLNVAYVTSDGLLQAGTGATLNLNRGVADNTGGTVAANAGVVNINGNLYGGFLNTNATGSIYLNGGTATLDGIHNNGLISLHDTSVNSSVTIHAGGTFSNNGLISMGADTLYAAANSGNTTAALNGTGVLTLAGGQIVGDSGVDFVNGAGHTIQGTGSFGSLNSVTNNGILRALGGDIHVYSNLTNYASHTLTGGTYDATGDIYINGGDINTNAASLILHGNGTLRDNTALANLLENLQSNTSAGSVSLRDSKFLATSGFTNAGSVTIDASSAWSNGGTAYVQTAGSTQVDGTLRTNGAGDSAGDLELEGGTLLGTGRVVANVTNSAGTVAPGDSTGTLTIQGDYTQQTGGEMDVFFADTSNFGVLNVTGNANLDGTLRVTVDSGFDPALGEQFIVLFSNALTGDFSRFISPAFHGEQFVESIIGNNVVLTVEGAPDTSAAPEPAAWLTVAGGLATILWLRRGR